MFDFFYELQKGGWVMIPIGIVSVLALGLFLERVFTLRRSQVFPASLVLQVRQLVLERVFPLRRPRLNRLRHLLPRRRRRLSRHRRRPRRRHK